MWHLRQAECIFFFFQIVRKSKTHDAQPFEEAFRVLLGLPFLPSFHSTCLLYGTFLFFMAVPALRA